MKDIMLIIVTLAAFAFGYYIMKKVDEFIYENRRQIALNSRKSKTQLWIAAEMPGFFDSISSALESCSAMNPYIDFFLSSGKAKRLLQKLLNGTLDIVLLSEEAANNLSEEFGSIRIPHQMKYSMTTGLGLTVDTIDEEHWLYVVWNKNNISKDRDRAIFAIENEHCRLKCGYCNYYD